MRQNAEELVLPLVDEAQGFRVDAERLGLTRVGHIFHRQEDSVGRSARAIARVFSTSVR